MEDKQYKCDMLPCREWTPDSKKCYLCNSNCNQVTSRKETNFHNLPTCIPDHVPSPQFAEINEPRASDLLESLTCDPDCEKIVITSRWERGV